MPESENGFVSCDWGTTKLRLRWVDLERGPAAVEVSSDEGVRHAFHRAGTRGSGVYREILARGIARLEAAMGRSTSAATVVVSGMASSSIGIVELPYANLPLALTGEGIIHRTLDESLPGGQRMILVSGVRSADDVMRGEEMQLAGLHLQLGAVPESVVYLLPGTHSKHAVVEGANLVDFRTYLTGELFEALREHTVLRNSVAPTADGAFSRNAFQAGVRAASNGSLLHALFLARTNRLFDTLDETENYWFLSGTVIGAEIEVLRAAPARRIRLCAGGTLGPLYEAAAQTLGLGGMLENVPATLVDWSAAWGQLAVFRSLINGSPRM